MALICDHCHKGKVAGHAVSPAKNRTHRFFKPNLQKLKVLLGAVVVHVKLCTRCIKRLRKDGHIGRFMLVKPTYGKAQKGKQIQKEFKEEKVKIIEKPKEVTVVKAEKEARPVKKLDIASIVGKKE